MPSLGLIETIKVVRGKMPLQDLHINRLWNSLKILEVHLSKAFIEASLKQEIRKQMIANNTHSFVFRVEVHKDKTQNDILWQYSIRDLDMEEYVLNDKGLRITVFPKNKKPINQFSNLKTTERKIYNEAIQFAQNHQCDDAIVLNSNNSIADTSIFNIFVVKNDLVYTPPLSDAPVAGVFRTLLLNYFPATKMVQSSITLQELYDADEIFLTNAVRGIRWVEYIEDKQLAKTKIEQLFFSLCI